MSGEQRRVWALRSGRSWYYPFCASAGALLGLLALLGVGGGSRWSALVWIVLVPLWVSRYRIYRRAP